jgi:hypothetical protein
MFRLPSGGQRPTYSNVPLLLLLLLLLTPRKHMPEPNGLRDGCETGHERLRARLALRR